MDAYSYRHLSDPVHGLIGLSKFEMDAISVPAFQRLRHIKQMGLTHYVFPGADYSRYIHCIGTCHVAGNIIGAINRNLTTNNTNDHGVEIGPQSIKEYRLAALYHDIGHLPFSHTMEHALSRYIQKREFNKENYYENHEDIGGDVLKYCPDIKSLLSNEKISAKKVIGLISGSSAARLRNIISSDFDADRIDYLLRTAHHTGLPYGEMDLYYLINQVRIDDEQSGLIYLNDKALGAADHFLISRFFQYKQVINNKTARAFEWLLEDIIIDLLKSRKIDLKKDTIRKMIKGEENPNKINWFEFDEIHMLGLIRALSHESKIEATKKKARAVLQRQAPRLITRYEKIAYHGSDTEQLYIEKRNKLENGIPELAEKFEISEDLWRVDLRKPIRLTVVPSTLSTGDIVGRLPNLDELVEKSIHIRLEDVNEIRIISEVEKSLTKVLSDQNFLSLRFYVLLDKNDDRDSNKIDEIKKYVKEEIGV